MDTLSANAPMPFELAEYERFLAGLLEDGFSFTDFSSVDAGEVLLRHDVDLSPDRALEMARIEAGLGIRSTYCFLLTSPAYNLLEVPHANALREIDRLGHDLALHFDTHHYWDDRPSTDELRSRVRAECDVLGQLIGTEIDVVSFHVPPEWVLDVDFDGFESAYQPAYFSEIEYVSDSNQKWRTEPPFPDGRPDAVQILVHPGLWHAEERPMAEIVADLAVDRHERVDRYLAPLGA